MIDLLAPPPAIRTREGTAVLLMHEALARSRQREFEERARRHALARQVTAGRGWARLAALAARRAARARRAAGTDPHGAVPQRAAGRRTAEGAVAQGAVPGAAG